MAGHPVCSFSVLSSHISRSGLCFQGLLLPPSSSAFFCVAFAENESSPICVPSVEPARSAGEEEEEREKFSSRRRRCLHVCPSVCACGCEWRRALRCFLEHPTAEKTRGRSRRRKRNASYLCRQRRCSRDSPSPFSDSFGRGEPGGTASNIILRLTKTEIFCISYLFGRLHKCERTKERLPLQTYRQTGEK